MYISKCSRGSISRVLARYLTWCRLGDDALVTHKWLLAVALMFSPTCFVAAAEDVELVSWQEDENLVAGNAALQEGKLAEAQEYFLQAERSVTAKIDDPYYLQGKYRIVTAARSKVAYIQLQQGDRKGAGLRYLSAMEQLRADYTKHMGMIDSKANQAVRKVSNVAMDKALDKLFSVAGSKVDRKISKHFSSLRETADEMVKVEPPQVEGMAVADEVEQHVVRIPVVPDSGYLRYVGKLRRSDGFCTGSLVGPGLALTNAHCIFPIGKTYDGKPKFKPRKGPWFFRHEWLYEYSEYEVLGYYTHQGRGGGWDGSVEEDWAILELGSPSNDSALPEGYLKSIRDAREIQTLGADAKSIFLGGYSGDLNNGFYMSMDWGCEFDQEKLAKGRIAHSCNSRPGSSGSPIFLIDKSGQPHLVGLNAGGYYYGGAPDKHYKYFAVNPYKYQPTLTALLNGDQPRIARGNQDEEKSSGISVEKVTDSVIPVLKKIWK